MPDILEQIAKIEHDQWMHWSKTLAENENLSPERIEKWKTLWVPYSELSEGQKESDRIWARRVMEINKTDILIDKYLYFMIGIMMMGVISSLSSDAGILALIISGFVTSLYIIKTIVDYIMGQIQNR